MRLARGVLRHHGENDLAGAQVLQPLFAADQFRLRGKDRGNPHQILGGNAGIAQRQLKRGQPFFVFPDAFCEKQAPRNHAFSQCLRSLLFGLFVRRSLQLPGIVSLPGRNPPR
jgi:hypothetical protein